MKMRLYPRLAWQGIRKNGKIYFPYLAACIFVVMVFYLIGFLSSDPVIREMEGGAQMQVVLSLGTAVMGVFSVIFLFYTNSFLMKRRKKELGLYHILGMDRKNIAFVLIWENLMTAGISLGTGNPVTEELAKTVPVTLTVVAYSAVIMSLGVLGVGMLGYLWRQKAGGMILSFLTMIGISVPGFYLGTAFIDLFAVRLGWISVSGNSGFARYFPVALCLSVLGICFYGQMLAASLEREMEQDYAMYLRCRGLQDGRILLFHAFPHAVVDLLPSFAQMLGLCLANAAIVERVFSLSGLGYLIIDAVVKRDSPVIHAAVLVLALTLVLLDTVAELLQYALRSDMRAAGGRA